MIIIRLFWMQDICNEDDDDEYDNFYGAITQQMDEYDNFYGAITQQMPLQGRLDKKPCRMSEI